MAGIRDGDAATQELLTAAIEASEPLAAWNRAIRLLGYRERSRGELTARLEEDGYPQPIIDQTLARLVQEAYLDDARFADAYVRAKRAAGWGRRRITGGLATRGVAPDIAARALDTHAPENEEAVRARDAIAGIDTATRPGAARAMRRLVTRGFSYDTARSALRQERDASGATAVPPVAASRKGGPR
ncbi:MAG TPA: RecX family transcriptional regulator [Coriobacteriia bacterium]|nr:RecX family transcriptional regulator [Coriobacteriia bacterium]